MWRLDSFKLDLVTLATFASVAASKMALAGARSLVASGRMH
jgi:hypothetical protein